VGYNRGRGAAIAVFCAALLAPSLASGASTPVYRDPPSYRGVSRAPATKAPPAARPPAPFSLSDAGTFPDVLVDEAGTAHLVWNEDRGDAADVVVYCRIKRAATGCDTRTDLSWDKSYADGDGPAFNSGGPPKIVRIGSQLLILSHRYPTLGTKPQPDGPSSSTVVAWASQDGGTTWSSAPAIIGKWNLGQLAVVGPEDDPTILNIGVDPLCDAPGPAGLCLEAFKSGLYSGGAVNLSTSPDENYAENLTVDQQGRPVIAAEDLNHDTSIRRWTGTGSPLDASTWTAPSVLGADEPSLAGGPAGVYMMARPRTGIGPYAVQRLGEQGDAYTASAATAVAAKDADLVLGRLYQDPGGRLFGAWEQRGKGLQLRTTAGRATVKPAFGSQTQLADGEGNGQISLGAGADGGGFVAYNHTGGVNGEGQIAIAGIGSQAPTGKPGIADVPGGGVAAGGQGTNGSCSELGFGSFTVDVAAGCILKGTGSHAQEYVTAGELNIWGVRIIPDAGVKIIVDPHSLQLDTTGSVRVVVTAPDPIGDVLLFHGELHRDLSKVVPGTDLFEFPTGLFKPSILGFDIGSDINVRLERDGVHIPLDLKLPPAFGGFSGHAEFVADRDHGLHVDSVHIHLGPVPLGALVINSIDLDYVGNGDVWTGAGSITVPAGGTLDLSARFAMGDFKSAEFSFTPGTPVPIGPFVYLLQFGGGFSVDPVVIDANATIGAGVAVAGESPVQVHGDFKMTFPKSGPADFRLSGTVSLFLFEIADGSLDFQTDGYAAFGGHAGVSLGPLSIDASMDGFIDAPTGTYGASVNGDISLCVEDPIEICASATAGAAISSKGFAACARFNPPDPFGGFEAGLTYPWSDWNPVFLFNPAAFTVSILTHIGACHTDEYRVAPTRARAAQAGGAPVAIPGGLPTSTILVQGDGGQPQVSVTGPGGTLTSGQPSSLGTVMTVKGVDAAYVILTKPKAGTWTVSALPGSAPVTKIMTADGYTPATVSAKLRGHGRSRSIAYRIAHLDHGQTVAFEETGKFGTHILGSAKGARGTLRFKPADAKGGRRNVFALIGHAGINTDRRKVGSYVAPGPILPGAVRSLRVRRAGTTLTASWRPAAGGVRYSIVLKGNKGTRLGRLVGHRVKRLRFSAVRRDERVQVSVRALSVKLRVGPARRVSSRGARR
jgi:hypothetical protein